MEQMIDLTKIIKPLRKKMDLSTKKLAEMADVSRSCIVSIEAGAYKPRLELAELVLDALGYELAVVKKGFADEELIRKSDALTAMKYWRDLEAYEMVLKLQAVNITNACRSDEESEV